MSTTESYHYAPAGGGFGELAVGEAPDDDLLAFDPGGVLGVLAIEVRADGWQIFRFCVSGFIGKTQKRLPVLMY